MSRKSFLKGSGKGRPYNFSNFNILVLYRCFYRFGKNAYSQYTETDAVMFLKSGRLRDNKRGCAFFGVWLRPCAFFIAARFLSNGNREMAKKGERNMKRKRPAAPPGTPEICLFLRKLRLESNSLQQDLAKYMNYSRASYTYLEDGKVQLSMAHLQKIAEFYGISPAVFFLPDLWGLTLEELRALDFTRVAA